MEELEGIIGFQKIRSYAKGILKLVLIAEADIIHHVAQTLGDVEGINADPDVREALLGDRDKTVAHATEEVFHLFLLHLKRTGGSTCSDRCRRSDSCHR